MPWSPGLMGGGTPARAQRFAGGPGAGGAAPWHGGCPPSSQLPSSPCSLSTEYFKTRLLQSGSSDLGCRRGWGGANFCGGSLPPPPVPHALCPPLPAPPALDGPERGSGQGGGHHGPCSQLLCDRTRSIFRISSAEKLPHCGVTSTFLLSAVGASPWDQGPGGPRRLSPFAWCYSWPRNPGEHSSLL